MLADEALFGTLLKGTGPVLLLRRTLSFLLLLQIVVQHERNSNEVQDENDSMLELEEQVVPLGQSPMEEIVALLHYLDDTIGQMYAGGLREHQQEVTERHWENRQKSLD